MKKESFSERCVSSENRDQMLTLSTQSQDDEQLQNIKWNATENYEDSNHLLYLQLEESSSFKTAAKLRVKNTQKEEFSQAQNEISGATTTKFKSPQQNASNDLEKCKKQTNTKNYEDVKKKEENKLIQLQNKKQSSIVSVYCKKSDITFISTCEEFNLKVENKTNNLDNEDPFSQLQMETILNKDEVQTRTSIYPVVESSSHFYSKKNSLQTLHNENSQNQNITKDKVSINLEQNSPKSSQITPNLNSNGNTCSEFENCLDDEDDDYDFLISSTENNALQKAIQRHSFIVKQYEIQQENDHQHTSHTSSAMNAYDLLLSLQKSIQNY